MDVRSIEAKAPVVEHNGTVPVWWMIESREFKDITEGGFLELVNEFEVPGGGLVDPHSHPTHEFYYVMNGQGHHDASTVRSATISQGDLVYIPPDKVHSLRPISDHAPIHCFCFAIGVKGAAANQLHHPLSGSGPGHPPPASRRYRPAAMAGHRDRAPATTTCR